VVDDFKAYPYLFNLRSNVALDLAHVRPGSPRAMPGQRTPAGVLVAHAAAPGQTSFMFGRRFPQAENWSTCAGLRFWYHGQDTGKPVTVNLLSRQAADPGSSAWKMVWSDEFNGPAGAPPNPNVWTHEVGDGSAGGNPGWGNREFEYYTNSTDNAALDGMGNLLITARKVGPTGGPHCYYGPCTYTSARLVTKNKVELAYGRVEARIRLPAGEGLWPAFWMLGTNIDRVGWPKSGEIDVMENVGRQPRRLYGTVHGPGYEGTGLGGTYDAASDLAGAFHTYAVEWKPGTVSWSIDGAPYFTATSHDVAPNPWVFDHPFYLLLNVAVGGSFGGPVGTGTTFPQSMAVDYVRLYQAPDTAQRFQSSFTDDFSGWRHITLPFRSFVRSHEQPPGALVTQLELKQIWGYTFQIHGAGRKDVFLAHVDLAPRSASCT
jgi:beta-glucanase (GH16 family)